MKAEARINLPDTRGGNLNQLLDLIADALIDRLEVRQSVRKRVLNVEQAAEYLGCSKDQVSALVAENKLIPVRFDRRLRFDIRELDRLVEESKTRSR